MKRTIAFRMPALYFSLILVLCPLLLWLPTLPTLSHAQVTPTAGAGGLGTAVTQVGNTYEITGGTRPSNGPNLFHSFGNFSIPTNNIANFLNETAQPTTNILSRVTGGNPSNIFGTIQTTGFGSSNLFLMNPAGIVFGPNASLNVGGSVNFTTADYLRFADGTHFNAIPGPADASISSAPIAAFGFLGSNPAAITVQGGQLSVAPGQNLSLVGGDITVQGAAVPEEGAPPPVQLSAPGGKIALASVTSPGEILAGTLEQTPNVNGDSFGALGTIQIIEKAALDASGDGGGTVLIRGGRFLIDDSRISANVTGPGSIINGVESIGGGVDIKVSQDAVLQNGALIDTTVVGNATPVVQYGGVHLKADKIEVRGILDFEAEIFVPTTIRSSVAPGSSAGRSGNIKLEANSILVQDFGQVETKTSGAGDAGDIVLRANENIDMIFGDVSSGSQDATGNAGNIELTSTNGNISTDSTTVLSQALFTRGNSGSITVTAPHGDILLTSSEINNLTFNSEALGGMQFAANNLTLVNSLISGLNFDPLAPGNITVALPGNLSLSGNSAIETVARGPARAADLTITAQNVSVSGSSFLSTESKSSGSGGQLNILTDSLMLTTGGQIRSPSAIGVDPDVGTPVIPSGAGGTINIQGLASPAGSILIDGAGSGIFTEAVGTGPGGNTNISVQSLTIQNGGVISASTSGIEPSATGGNISISSIQSTTLNNGGSITASSTGPANAGNIAINAGSQFMSQNASVTTEASQASGGNIVVQATDSIRLVNSQISTSVQGGPDTSGGNITIDPTFMTLQNSQILAQAVQGQGGNINIVAGTFLADQTSLVSASSQFGLSGAVNIQSPVSMLSGTLATLPQRPLQVQHLLQQRCAAQANGQLSSLVVAGRDTLPSEPGGWLMSSMALLVRRCSCLPAQPSHQ